MIVWKCPTCGQQLHAPSEGAGQTFICPSCQQPTIAPLTEPASLGLPSGAESPPGPGSPFYRPPRCSRIAYVLLGVFLGAFGVHNFVAGYNRRAVTQLIVSLMCCLLVLTGFVCCVFLPAAAGVAAMYIWAIVEVCTVSRDAEGVPMN
jgi:TM2 domain-containing membrane protein YozV